MKKGRDGRRKEGREEGEVSKQDTFSFGGILLRASIIYL